MIYFNSLKYFVHRRQGPLERDNRYIKNSRSEIETLILDGGRHVLCSTYIMEEVDQSKLLEKEATSEEDKFSMINLLQMLDPVNYGIPNKDLHNGAYVGRGKYTTTSGGPYEFMVCSSGRYQSIGNDGNRGKRGN